MDNYFSITVELIGQFSAHRGGVDHNIVQFILAGSSWALLLWFALYREKKKHLPHENLLVWGFGFGLLRESFMLTMALLNAYGLLSGDTMHIFFPPLEHALLDYAMVFVCGAYLRYLLQDMTLSKRYLQAGVAAVTLCYLATFLWWGDHIISDPTSKFGQTWCDWIFRINSSIFIAIAFIILVTRTRGWIRNAVSVALLFFFLHEFLKIPDMALGEVYEGLITPFRHGFYLLGIPILGYIYVREQFELQESTEKALQQSEELYRSLAENINLGITLIDKNHTVLMANRAQHEMFGKPVGYFTGKKCYQEFEKRDQACGHCPGTVALKTGQTSESETEGVRDDGTSFKVRIKAFPVKDQDGNVESFIEVVEDVTERVKIEEELQRARNLESVGVLAGGIAHDFNNILASIFGFTDLAKLKLRQNDDISKELAQITRASQRARDLVQQILTISRKQEQEKIPLQLSSLIKEALKLLRSSIPATIDIRQDITSEAVVLADETQINQLIMNLCTNAYQAMAAQGGTLAISLTDQTINSSDSLIGEHVLEPGSYVVLKVNDTGPGMEPSVRSKIFEPYFTTKEVGKGTGLGLAVVHGIVKSHHGRINVYSEPGTGTSFSVYLPAIEAEATTLATPEEDFHFEGTERIMVIDDEHDIRDALTQYLSKFGFTIDVFANGQKAWNAFAEKPDTWDLVITDQTMPELTGAQFITKARQARPGLPVILCTGYSETINEDLIKKLGINAFLSKPVSMSDLLRAIHSALNDKKPDTGQTA